MSKHPELENLIATAHTLRNPGGCPWSPWVRLLVPPDPSRVSVSSVQNNPGSCSDPGMVWSNVPISHGTFSLDWVLGTWVISIPSCTEICSWGLWL